MSLDLSSQSWLRRTLTWCTSHETRRARLLALFFMVVAGVLAYFTFQRWYGTDYSSEVLPELPSWQVAFVEALLSVEGLVTMWAAWALLAIVFARSQNLSLQRQISWST